MKRSPYRGKPGIAENIGKSLLILLLGLALGAASKWTDLHLPLLAELTSRIALWIFLASAVALGSSSPVRAGIHSLLLLGGMVAAYYAAAALLDSVWSKNFLIGWGAAALLSPVFGALVWFARERRAWLISCGVIAAQLGATLFLFQRLAATDLAVIAVTAVMLFWNKLDVRKNRRRRR